MEMTTRTPPELKLINLIRSSADPTKAMLIAVEIIRQNLTPAVENERRNTNE